MPGLAEEPRGRADEHEAAVAAALDPAQEAPRGEEGGRQVGAQRRLPALERQLPHGHVLLRPDAGDRSADVELARGLEKPVRLGLVGEVGGDRESSLEFLRQSLGSLPAEVVVDDDLAALAGEGARAGRADPPRGSGDEHALALESALHE